MPFARHSARVVRKDSAFFFIYKKKCKHCLSDWPSQRNLLEVFVSMSCSGGMSDALEEMKALRNRNLRDTREEVELRTAFLRTNGAAFRMWLLQSSHFCHAAKRQLMWHSFQAKFYGLSRTGIRAMSNFGLLCPLTSVDRHWKTLISQYLISTRYDARAHSRHRHVLFFYIN